MSSSVQRLNMTKKNKKKYPRILFLNNNDIAVGLSLRGLYVIHPVIYAVVIRFTRGNKFIGSQQRLLFFFFF